MKIRRMNELAKKERERKERILDEIKKEIMGELGIPPWIINTNMYANLPSRLCGYIGNRAKEMYTVLTKLDLKDYLDAQKEEA
ncbi:hypothetical protein D3C81_1910400 [compost metagenome]